MIRTPAWWGNKNMISHALLPFSWAYGLAARARYRSVTPKKLPVAVLCIGNLTAGGAGKTPAALAIGALLKAQDARAFYLSRGYGGALKGPLQVDPAFHSAAQAGDEPLLLARMLPTIVAHNRLQGAEFAIASGAQVIIMDDGFQNPTLHKDLCLLVVDTAYGFGNGRLIPAGPLRETKEEGLKRAQGIIAIQASPGEHYTLAGAPPVFHATIQPEIPCALHQQRVIGFCGIAHPEKFRATLLKAGADMLEFFPFADHYAYSSEDIRKLLQQAAKHNAILVTTEKDAVRLPSKVQGKIHTLPIRLQFEDEMAIKKFLMPLLERKP